ncbi:O-antigen ligase family protein, partial [Paenibacillus sp. TAF58]
MTPDLPIHKKPMYYGAIYVLLAVMVGVAAAYQPMFSILGLGVLFSFVYAIYQPEKMSYLVLLSTAISINYIVEANMPGLEIISLYKLGILLLLVPSMLQNGLRWKFIYPIAAIASMLFLTIFFSDWHPRLTLSLTLKAFIGLTLPFFFLMIKWKKGTALRHIRIICLLPLVSVGTGVLLQLAHLYSFLNVEFTGAIRVQGANIAPHLAMLAFLGITVALIETKRNPLQARFYYCTLAANFAILIATGTRGPILAMLAMAAYYFYDMVKQYIKGKLILIIPLLCSLALIGGA